MGFTGTLDYISKAELNTFHIAQQHWLARQGVSPLNMHGTHTLVMRHLGNRHCRDVVGRINPRANDHTDRQICHRYFGYFTHFHPLSLSHMNILSLSPTYLKGYAQAVDKVVDKSACG